ncbi:hypothetical protein FQZ97_778430 [compost metagenome]
MAALISSTAAAPSLRVEALPAVTLPSFLNAGFSLARDSAVVPARTCSSVSKASGSPLRCGIRIGVISSLKRPASMAAAALRWDSAAKASCSSRLRPYFSTRFSAVMPMW